MEKIDKMMKKICMEVQKGNADNTIKPMSRNDLESVAMLFASEVNRLNEIIESMKRHAFGRKSEKFDPNQLDIFELLGLKDSAVVVEEDSTAPAAKAAKKKGLFRRACKDDSHLS